MDCIIIDDNELAIKTLKSLISNFYPSLKILGSAQTIIDSVKLINECKPDLVFLDVEIKNEMGFDLFNYFSSPSFDVIFTTAHEKYALQAIKKNCFDYLLKPIDTTDLIKTITAFENSLFLKGNSKNELTNFKHKKLAFIDNTEYIFTEEKNIIYLKADGKYTDIHTTEKKVHKSSKNLGEIELLLSVKFFKCHKGCIINMDHIVKFSKEELTITMINNHTIDLAFRRKEDFLNLFNRF